jgi:hypothetical protein
MSLADGPGTLASMLLVVLSELYREFARQGLSYIGEVVSFDSLPKVARRSRVQHFRNGIGSVLVGTSTAAWRHDSMTSAWYATRKPVRRQVSYGLAELRRAGTPSSAIAWRHTARRLAFAAVAVAGLRILASRAAANHVGGGGGPSSSIEPSGEDVMRPSESNVSTIR